MNAVRKLFPRIAAELQVRFVDERGGLECVVGPLPAEVPGGNTA
jgi:hypothetical protein